eukprot:CAMPEP_0116871772 /NCGR_PEP_ID=MMETSP0463-20121206/2265_1 /TAXON_ID=181622 /ORGANISM="Strombidinopsis sp, Strain SopsisLIS2011" /LENGTH=85 /DNA_ID=CAMNT_0004510813 /DNA_START=996 /DNA_END=1253 /DNA_ORIENTATION=-
MYSDQVNMSNEQIFREYQECIVENQILGTRFHKVIRNCLKMFMQILEDKKDTGQVLIKKCPNKFIEDSIKNEFRGSIYRGVSKNN